MRHSTSRTSADRHASGLGRTSVEKVDDSKFMQNMKYNGFSGETQDEIEHVHPYGFVNVPKKPTGTGKLRQAAEAFIQYLCGNRSHGIAVVTGDRRFRLYQLEEGEVALHDDQGHQIHIKRDGVWVSAPNSKKITAQIMQDDQMPQDQGQSNSQTKNGQVKQAGRQNVASYTIDKNGFTLDHPNGDVTINAKTFTVTTSGEQYLNASGNVNVKGSNVFAVGKTYLGVDSKNEIVQPVVETEAGPSKQTYSKAG